ncbi:hypothetical protein [Nannocystis pusilla]|uniref:hypothetical protein n=1 Tax=Nannocystis pusilla TaxID=889268 RepID=UPI003B81B4C8
MSILVVAADSCLRTLYSAYLAIAPQGAQIEAEREARAEWFICTLSGESDTGRVWGRVQKLESGYCIRDRVGARRRSTSRAVRRSPNYWNARRRRSTTS